MGIGKKIRVPATIYTHAVTVKIGEPSLHGQKSIPCGFSELVFQVPEQMQIIPDWENVQKLAKFEF